MKKNIQTSHYAIGRNSHNIVNQLYVKNSFKKTAYNMKKHKEFKI